MNHSIWKLCRRGRGCDHRRAARTVRSSFGIPRRHGIFGFTAEEAVGQSLDLIIPERFRARHWEGYREVMSTGKTKYQSDVLRVPAAPQTAARCPSPSPSSLLDAPDGGGRLIAAIVRDETARWKEERELRKRLAELEKQSP